MNLHPQCRSPNVILALVRLCETHGPQGTRFRANKAQFTRHVFISLSACKKDFLTGGYSPRISCARNCSRYPYERALPVGNAPLTIALLRLDPMFDPLRKDPRFQKLLRAQPRVQRNSPAAKGVYPPWRALSKTLRLICILKER